MDGPPAAAAVKKPCCICKKQGGKHCTKCKSRHYCGKACQLVDWYERGHKAQCKRLASEYQDRLLDSLMPEKLKIEEEAPRTSGDVEDVAPAAGSTAQRLSAVLAGKTEVNALNDGTPNWRRGTCAICLDLLSVEAAGRAFYSCCCMKICTECSDKCDEYDTRCPLCRSPACKSHAEFVRRVQKHADEGNAEAQVELGYAYRGAAYGLKNNFERAHQLFERAAAQGNAQAQNELGFCYERGVGVKIDDKTAALWYRRAAEQGYPSAQCNLGIFFYHGKGVAQSYEEALKWYRLAAAQGSADALYELGACHANGVGVPLDEREALRIIKRAAAKGHAGAAAAVEELEAWLAATRPG